MVWTLHKYIFREMGKTFLLTAAGLIAVLGLGGGVMNMIELEGLSALQMIKILILVLPIAATLTLPIAALYSATVTYGRLSADNELVACRSGGINIHVLLLPAAVISMLAALGSFLLVNFAIPQIIRNIDWLVRSDIPRIIRQKLTSADTIPIGNKYVLYSRRSELLEAPGTDPRLRLSGIAFVEMDDDTWTRYGTARTVEMKFGADLANPTVSADMYDLTIYDAKEEQYSDHKFLPIGNYPLPMKLPVKVKWLTLGGLLQYGRQPSLFPEIEEDLSRLRGGIARALFVRELRGQFEREGRVVVRSPDVEYEIRAGQLTLDSAEAQPLFEGNVTITERRTDGGRRTITADSATMREDRSAGLVQIRATGNVSIVMAEAPDRPIRRNSERLTPVPLSDDALRQARIWTDAALLDAERPLNLGRKIEEKRQEVVARVGKIDRAITGELHARTAFSLSVLVLVTLGAALGIVYKGAQVLVAFGISFVPSVLVVSLVIMGKQLIDKPATVQIGIAVIWFGLALVAALDVYVLARKVRR